MDFKKHQEALFERMQNNSALLIFAAHMKVRSHDTHYPYRPSSNFYYATGFSESDAALLLKKSDNGLQRFIFVHPKDPVKEMWEGQVLGVEAASDHLDMDRAFSIEDLQTELRALLKHTQTLYLELPRLEPRIEALLTELWEGKEAHLYAKNLVDLRTLFAPLRRKKSAQELTLIKKGMALTQKAHHLAMAKAKPGLYEYEIMALVEYLFKEGGATSDAYTTIVAGGNRANTLHYIQNSARLKDGDLILLDAGCEYGYYATDVTRTFPVNGRFSKEQRALYEGILSVQKEIISMIKPGVLRSELHDKAARGLSQLLYDLKVVDVSKKALIDEQKYKRYFPHGIGHWMGLDVHDPLPYRNVNDEELPLEEGDVITIEPGLYLDEHDGSVAKAYRGMGIRIEDDILVTAQGYENLSASIVKEVEEIEALCQKSLTDYV